MSAPRPFATAELANLGALLDFLEGYYRLARPPVRDINDYGEYVLREDQFPAVPGLTLSPAADTWLSSELVEHEQMPFVPEALNPFITPQNLSPIERPSVPLFNDSDDRTLSAALLVDDWVRDVWDPWAASWTQIERSRSFYKTLYGLRAQLDRDRDSLELIWGFGRLRWATESGQVDHPLLTIAVELTLEEEGRLCVIPSGPVEIESACLTELSLADRHGYLSLSQAGIADETDPWAVSGRQELLKRLLRFIDHDGVFAEPEAGAAVASHAKVTDEWVFFVQRRAADYLGFLEAQRELYKNGASATLPFQSLVVDQPSSLTDPIGEGEASTTGSVEDTTLYLPKPANEEQFRILRLAQSRPGVTAQGPPGTGKSHTIANLICHFAAQGKRVLVTAEKEQALAVLAEKLPPAVRELTVAVLGSDQMARTRLEQTVNAIQERVSSYDSRQVEADITRGERLLAETDGAIALASNQLRAALAAEGMRLAGTYEAGRDPSPSIVAAWLQETETDLTMVPDDIPMGAPLPLDVASWSQLVELSKELDRNDIEACSSVRPRPGKLPSGAELALIFEELSDLRERLAVVERGVASWERIDATTSDELDLLVTRLESARRWRRETEKTWLEQVAEEAAAPLTQREWQEFFDRLTEDREAAIVCRIATAASHLTVPENPDEETVERLREALARFASGRGVSKIAHRRLAKELEACSVDGRTPTTDREVDLCLTAISLARHRRRLRIRWANGVSRVAGPLLDEDRPAEDAVADHLAGIGQALAWSPTTWKNLSQDISALGLTAPNTPSLDELDQLISTMATIAYRVRERQLDGEIRELDLTLRAGIQGGASPLWSSLADALTKRAWSVWDDATAEARRLAGLEDRVARFGELRVELAESAPRLANKILSSREDYAPDYALLGRAWQWRQLEGWLASTTAGPTSSQLQWDLEDLAIRRLRIMEDTVAARAWRGLVDSFDDQKRGALSKYLTAMKRFGKTGGKYKARWLREIRDALNESKEAVPIWIMPTGKVLGSFRPEASPPFDVLIVDEASQIGLLGLPILSLAAKAIIVGDDQQTSPENVGLDRQSVFDLIDNHLSAVKDSRTKFDADNSLYDVALQQFPEVVVLREHFRCLPQIIRFSNGRYYNDMMVPLRDDLPAPGWNPVGSIFVSDGFRNGKDINEAEALAVVDLIAELCVDPTYDGMSFGVVNLLGRAQSQHIRERLFDRLGPQELEERNLRCGEPADFQGDERDIVVISMVADKTPGARIGAMTDRKAERRVNVAASRPKNQLWVVHSVEPEEFPAGDPRAELIRYCRDPGALDIAYANLEERCESKFERDVLRRILERGYRRVRTQHQVGGKRIDIVIEGPESRLAVECDGDAWHEADRWEDDRVRQQTLERAGWTFERIRGSAFYRHPQTALDSLWARLEELGIPTGDWVGHEVVSTHSAHRTAPLMADRETMRIRNEPPTADLGYPESRVNLSREVRFHTPNEVANDSTGETGQAESPTGDSKTAPHQHRVEATPSIGSRGFTPVLAAYVSWPARAVDAVMDGGPDQVTRDLVEIVSAEGPMHALYLYQLHTTAAGGQRVGREMRRIYNRLVNHAVRGGQLAQVQDDLPGQINKTLYVPGTLPVVIRALGPRQLHEVPRSEIHELVKLLEGPSLESQAVKRAILSVLGLTRMTQKTSEYLDECLEYAWAV